MKKIFRCFIVLFALSSTDSIAQENNTDSIKFNYPKIYSLCLDGNVKPALALVEYDTTKKISIKDANFKIKLENRFKYDIDKSIIDSVKKSDIDDLVQLFQRYWRKSLLNSGENYDSLLILELKDFLNKTLSLKNNEASNDDSIDFYMKKYIQSKGLHTTGYGRTGKFLDLLVWKSERDTVYSFKLNDEKISSRVFMMDDFITLGWEEYATLGRLYPGGWATSDALYCVEKSYDLNSENFLISYLAHESRHFADYKLFPKLKSADLEYRGKLTELSMANKTLYDLIKFFINNANYESENGHSVANYRVVHDLSKSVFNVDFEKDIDKWKTISVENINKAAYDILQLNTLSLQLRGDRD